MLEIKSLMFDSACTVGIDDDSATIGWSKHVRRISAVCFVLNSDSHCIVSLQCANV